MTSIEFPSSTTTVHSNFLRDQACSMHPVKTNNGVSGGLAAAARELGANTLGYTPTGCTAVQKVQVHNPYNTDSSFITCLTFTPTTAAKLANAFDIAHPGGHDATLSKQRHNQGVFLATAHLCEAGLERCHIIHFNKDENKLLCASGLIEDDTDKMAKSPVVVFNDIPDRAADLSVTRGITGSSVSARNARTQLDLLFVKTPWYDPESLKESGKRYFQMVYDELVITARAEGKSATLIVFPNLKKFYDVGLHRWRCRFFVQKNASSDWDIVDLKGGLSWAEAAFKVFPGVPHDMPMIHAGQEYRALKLCINRSSVRAPDTPATRLCAIVDADPGEWVTSDGSQAKYKIVALPVTAEWTNGTAYINFRDNLTSSGNSYASVARRGVFTGGVVVFNGERAINTEVSDPFVGACFEVNSVGTGIVEQLLAQLKDHRLGDVSVTHVEKVWKDVLGFENEAAFLEYMGKPVEWLKRKFMLPTLPGKGRTDRIPYDNSSDAKHMERFMRSMFYILTGAIGNAVVIQASRFDVDQSKTSLRAVCGNSSFANPINVSRDLLRLCVRTALTDGITGRDDYYKCLSIMDGLWAKRDVMERQLQAEAHAKEARRQDQIRRLATEKAAAEHGARESRAREAATRSELEKKVRDEAAMREELTKKQQEEADRRNALDSKNASRRRGKRDREGAFEDQLRNKVIRLQSDIGITAAHRVNGTDPYVRLYKRSQKTMASKKATDVHFLLEAIGHCFTPVSRKLGGGWRADCDIELEPWVTSDVKNKLIKMMQRQLLKCADAKGVERYMHIVQDI